MTYYFNDSPIESPDDDIYGMAPFAKSLAKSILRIEAPIGTTIALNGAWGAGKSSVVNLIRNELQNGKSEKLQITDFKCWWYRGEEALVLAFFQHLNTILRDSLGDKVKNLVPEIGRRLLQAAPTIGAGITLATGAPVGKWIGFAANRMPSFADRFFPPGETVEKLYHKLAEILAEEDRRFLIIVDDIDRLSSDEVLAIFRLVKAAGHLPNVLYLLAFDRVLAQKIVRERFPSEGPHFLEKIIQAEFEIPTPLQFDISKSLVSVIQQVCGTSEDRYPMRVMNIFYDVVFPCITMPRHVVRLHNTIAITWPALEESIDVGDFIALETLRLYDQPLFQLLRSLKDIVCISAQQGVTKYDQDTLNRVLEQLDAPSKERAKIVLKRLFPCFEDGEYPSRATVDWDRERRVCIDKHYETYFRFTLSEESLSLTAINQLIANAGNASYVGSLLRKAATTVRRNNSSLVPVYLDALTAHAGQVKRDNVRPLLKALFSIHDEINLARDNERGNPHNPGTTKRFDWLTRRLVTDRFDLDEKLELYDAALSTASLGWLVHFVANAEDEHKNREVVGRTEHECLVPASKVSDFVNLALTKIRIAASDGTLIMHPDLAYILYRWKGFMGGVATEVRSWTDSILDIDGAVMDLASAFMTVSWVHLPGDSVPTPRTVVNIDLAKDMLEIERFRTRVEQIIAEGALPNERLETLKRFFVAWGHDEH